jgi:hypothetical protein
MFRDVLVEVRDKVMALKKEGRSLPEIAAANPAFATTHNGATVSLVPAPLSDWCIRAFENHESEQRARQLLVLARNRRPVFGLTLKSQRVCLIS